MRKRAYTPEFSCALENRSLLSGFAASGLSAHPSVITRAQFNLVPERIQAAFHQYRQGFGMAKLHEEIFGDIVNIPFARADGLAESVNGILNKLQQDAQARVPNAVSKAHNDVIAVTRADVQARVQAGDIVVR
jgi:hypothetical protein